LLHDQEGADRPCVRADGITLGSDIKGVSGVKEYMQAYIDKYDFEHEVITGAVDEQAQVTFSFWQDKVRDAFSLLCLHQGQPQLYGRYCRFTLALKPESAYAVAV
jgi:hypothetical protein